MNQDFKHNKIEQLVLELHNYIDLRIKQAKLSAVDGLSVICSAVISAMITAFFICLAVILLSMLITYSLALALDSIILSMLVMAGIFIVIGIIFWRKRRKMFVDSMVGFFIKVFFENHHKPKPNE